MKQVVATTPRLELRRFTEADAEGFYALNADPEVLRYTGDEPFGTVEEARVFLARYDHYRRHDFGRWSVYLRDAQRFVGFCGLKHDDETGQVDLGFRIAREQWGRGLATEAARAALELGFHRYSLDAIIGRAMPDNTASHRVLTKLGFTEAGETHDVYGRWLVYELTRAAFDRR